MFGGKLTQLFRPFIKACVIVTPKESKRLAFNVDNIRVAKIIGSGVLSSQAVKGMVFRREVEGTIRIVKDAKVCCEIHQ